MPDPLRWDTPGALRCPSVVSQLDGSARQSSRLRPEPLTALFLLVHDLRTSLLEVAVALGPQTRCPRPIDQCEAANLLSSGSTVHDPFESPIWSRIPSSISQSELYVLSHIPRRAVMPKSRADHAEAINNVTSAWVSRGYRHDYLVANQGVKDPDPAGELAYQRAFAEAVKKVPPRLPNPAHYPNSSSAVALIQKQNLGIFNARQSDAPNPKYEQPIADMYWRSKEDEQKYRSASSTPPATNGQTHISPTQQNGFLPQPNGQHTPPPQAGSRNPPLLMEPKLGAPMGPPSRFR